MLKGFTIHVAHCDCGTDFLYVTGKINLVMNKNSDVYRCPRCPSCGQYNSTRTTGMFEVDKYHIEERR